MEAENAEQPTWKTIREMEEVSGSLDQENLEKNLHSTYNARKKINAVVEVICNRAWKS